MGSFYHRHEYNLALYSLFIIVTLWFFLAGVDDTNCSHSLVLSFFDRHVFNLVLPS